MRTDAYRRIVDNAPFGVLFFVHGVCIDANPMAHRLLGCEQWRLVGAVLDSSEPAEPVALATFKERLATAAAGVGEWLQPTDRAIVWTPWLVAAVLYVAIGPSLIAYRLWGLGVARAGPTVAAFFANLTPLFAALLSAALLGEWPRLFHGLAFALIVAGIVVSSRPLRVA